MDGKASVCPWVREGEGKDEKGQGRPALTRLILVSTRGQKGRSGGTVAEMTFCLVVRLKVGRKHVCSVGARPAGCRLKAWTGKPGKVVVSLVAGGEVAAAMLGWSCYPMQDFRTSARTPH